MRAGILLLCVATVIAMGDPQMLPREWRPGIPLAQVTILDDNAALCNQLGEALRAAGSDVVVMDPEAAMADNGLRWKPEVSQRTVIVLGGIHTNPAMMPLYGDYLALGDAAYPGDDGFVIRTIARPLGEGTAAIALEAGSPTGETQAVARFVELLAGVEGGVLPATFEAHLDESLASLSRGLAPSLRYLMLGDEKTGAEGVFRLIGEIRDSDGWFRFGDYGIERRVRDCAHLQDVPGVSAEDVQTLDEALLRTALASADQWWRSRGGSRIGSRHNTMGTSCFTAAVQLLRRRGKPNEEAQKLLDQWWGECEAYWQNACSTFHDDLEGIPSYYCPEPTLDWALSMGLDDYVKNQLPLVAQRALAVVDNRGYYAGTGTYEECRPGDLYKTVPGGWVMKAAHFFHPDQGFDWLYDNLPGTYVSTWAVGRNFAGVRAFARPETSDAPLELLGTTVVPLGSYRYERLAHSREKALNGSRRYVPAPLERTFEKLCMRDSFEPEGQYLVFQGYQGAAADNLPAMDANCLIRYTDLGHVWLHSNSEQAGKLNRSAVFCSDGANDGLQPVGCELQALQNGKRVGLAASHFADYNGCDWTRNVIWVRGRYFVLIDLMRQTADEPRSLTCTFRTPQRAWLEPDGMIAREENAEMHVLNADDVGLALDGGHELEGAAIPTLLRETQLLDGGPGSVRTFRNLVYSSDPSRQVEAMQFQALGESAGLVRGRIAGEDELALVAASPAGTGITVGPFNTDGQVLYVSMSSWAQAGGEEVTLNGTPLDDAGEDANAAVRDALEELWASTREPSRASAQAIAEPVGEQVWSYDSFTPLPAPVPAPVFRSEPEGQGNVLTLLDGVVTRWATVRWPRDTRVTVDVDLRNPTRVQQIDFNSGVFGRHNTIPNPAEYPEPRTLIAEFSNGPDSGAARTRTLTFTSDCTFEGLHKGVVYPILRWTCADVGETARNLKLTFEPDTWSGLGMNEFSVRGEGPSAARIVDFVLRDVNGDGSREIIAWSDRAELAVIRGDGSELMCTQLPGHITAAECYRDLSADGPRLLVTTREARLYCLDLAGKELWRTDFLASAELNGDLPTAYSIGLLKRPDGSPLIMTGNYNLATFVSPEGKVLKYQRLPAAYQTMTLPRGFDYDGDGKEDILTSEVWGCLSLLDTDMGRKTSLRLPRGRGIVLEYFGQPTPERARVLICTENGVGLFNAKTAQYVWRHDVRPITDCAFGDIDGDGKQEIVLGKTDGYVLVYGEDGELKHVGLIGESVRAVAVVPAGNGKATVAVALPGRVVEYRPDGDPAVIAKGDYLRLAASGEPGRLLAFREGAAVDAFDLPAPH